MWSIGSILGICLVSQFFSGIFLAMYYTPNVSLAFDSTVYISRDVNYGWLIRSLHANGASAFFVLIYIHMGRGLYYGSYKIKKVWNLGVLIFFLSIITAFLGYVLPWGQISYWAATVITNLISAIPYVGNSVVTWVWGGFSVMNATLTRFFAIHFILPFFLLVLSLLHLFFLHQTGSRNPLGVKSSRDSVPFHSFFVVKDLLGFIFFWLFLVTVVFFFPLIISDPENFVPANSLVTPTHIQPEWYFLPIYAILRSIPNKLGGVIALVIRVGVLFLYPLKSRLIRSVSYIRVKKIKYWLLILTFFVLMWIGRKTVEIPYERVGYTFTIIYFFYTLIYLRYILSFELIKGIYPS